MYEAFYGLRERPFNLTPDPKYLYLSEKHKEAFAHLLYGIKNRSGFVMITGEIGTGKTTLCRNLLNQLDSGTEVAFIFNPFLDSVELMKKINQEFGIKSQADTILGLTEELNVHLLNSTAHAKSCVLVIDEAQNLSPQVLEQIRLLSNLETDSEKLLQIILIGQPELAEKLQLRELRQLNQRITARYHLKALNALETLQYIAYRIHVAGGRKRINFTKRAVKQAYKLSGGVPRMINAICDRSLLIGYTKEQRVITVKLVRQAMREIKGEKVAAPKTTTFNWRRWLPAPPVAVLLIATLALAHYLVDPLDRFARELRFFNTILSGELVEAPRNGEERTSPLATADSLAETPALEEGDTAQRGALLQVMERLNASGSTRPSQSLAPVLAELGPQDALQAGLDALIALWNRNLPEGYPEAPSVEDLVSFFEKQGLDCEKLTPALGQISSINLPGLVRMRLGNNDFWMGIVRADDRTVTLLAEGNRRVTVSHDEFNLYYGRELLVPWQDPAPNAPVLAAGQRGPGVNALKEQLRAVGRLRPNNTSDVYDKETEAAVRALQSEAGLNADGKAGRQVRLALASGQGNTPALRRGGNQTAMQKRVPEQSEKVSSAPPVKKSAPPVREAAAAPVEVVADAGETGGVFRTIEETPPHVEAMPAEPAPVLASAGQDETPEEKNVDVRTAPDDGATAENRDIVNWLRRQARGPAPDTADESAEAPGQNTIMQVRELPDIDHPTALDLPEDRLSAVTAPVWGSTPLVPHEETAY